MCVRGVWGTLSLHCSWAMHAPTHLPHFDPRPCFMASIMRLKAEYVDSGLLCQVDPAFIAAETEIEMGKEDVKSRPEQHRWGS